MSEKITIRKEVGKSQEISPLKRAFQLKMMLEAIRGKRSSDEDVRRIVGRIKSE